MRKDVEKLCQTCLACKQVKSKVLPRGLYPPLPIPSEPLVDISIDFVLGLPRSKKGKNYVFVPCGKTNNTMHVRDLFFNEIVRLHGIPKTIVSDRDVKFLSHFWRTLWNKLGTKLLFSTTCHPQTDGQTEVVNRTFGTLLRALIQKNLKNLEEYMPHIEFAYNCILHSSTNCLPFEIVYGFNPLTPMDLIQLPIDKQVSLDGKKKADFVRDLHSKVREHIEKKTKLYAENANKGRKRVVFEQGDWVWVHMREERFPNKRKSKLHPRGDGPFQVLERINDNAYKIDLPGEYNVSATFNVSDLSLFNVGSNSRSNLFEERGNDTAAQVTDPLEMPRGPITRARAKKFKEALLNLIKTNYLEGFEEGEMKEGTSHTTYACMTIVVHED